MPKVAKGINRRLPIIVTDSLVRRFWNSVEQGGPDDCWPWKASFRNGYGAIKHQGRVLSAHRVSYVIHFGEPEPGLVIAHTCDNRSCCNPNHLEAVTPKKNNNDARKRLEFASTEGSSNPNATIDESVVIEIWAQRRKKITAPKIAEALGVSPNVVKSIVQGRSWKHCQPLWYKKERGLI